MNLNNFLCSHFEPNKDGKVTIGNVADIVIKLSIIVVILCLITIWLGGLLIYTCEGFGIISEADIPHSVVDGEVIGLIVFFFIAGLLSILVVIVIIAVILLAGYIIDKICSISIASCPVKKEDDEDKDLVSFNEK